LKTCKEVSKSEFRRMVDYRAIQPDPEKLDIIGEAWVAEKLGDDSECR